MSAASRGIPAQAPPKLCPNIHVCLIITMLIMIMLPVIVITMPMTLTMILKVMLMTGVPVDQVAAWQ